MIYVYTPLFPHYWSMVNKRTFFGLEESVLNANRAVRYLNKANSLPNSLVKYLGAFVQQKLLGLIAGSLNDISRINTLLTQLAK